MKQILKIGVLMGGLSPEHEISLETGKNVLESLDRSKYEPVAIVVSRNREWFVGKRKTTEQKALKECDLIFNALHGKFGEDGTVQALMEYRGVRYTGSGVLSSALAMDKLRSREIFKLAGLKVPNTLKIRRGENYQALLKLFVNKATSFPVVVKPCSGGSSVGVSIVKNAAQLQKAIKEVFKLDRKALIEEFIKGREVTCGVLDYSGQATVMPVTEVVPKKKNVFFSYNAKYKAGHSDEITPAFLDSELAQKVQDITVKAHQILGCKAYSRSDMIIGENGIYLLEINTLPGLTATSLVPKAALAAGLSFSQLLDRIIDSSLV